MLMNLETLQWDDTMLKEFSIPRQTLPTILGSGDDFGTVKNGLLKDVPITGVIGDQQSACIGHLLKEGEIKNTYGTGSFLLSSTGNRIVHSTTDLLTTVLFKTSKDNTITYALEGSVESAGSTLNWLKNNLHLFDDFETVARLFRSVNGNDGVTFVPAFGGLFAPHWSSTAKALLVGINSDTQIGNIIHATFEGIAMRTKEVIRCFEKETGKEVTHVKVDGGLTCCDEFLQTQSNVLEVQVERKEVKEVTSIGCAIISGLQFGIWSNMDEIRNCFKIDKTFEPQWSKEKMIEFEASWNKAVGLAKSY